jgi:hypothetical protein
MKKTTVKRLLALLTCLMLVAMAILPVSATTPEEDAAAAAIDKTSVGMFWGTFALIGLILPAALAVVGVVLARSEARGKPTYWYGLSIVCGAWLVFSIALMVLLLVI